MNDSDSFFNKTNNNKRSGENYLPSSISSPRGKSIIVSKTAVVRLQILHLPLVSTATGSPVDSLTLEPDRPYSIGRASINCDFTFDNRLVSRQHCQILFDSSERKIYVLDGTFLLPAFSSVVNEFRKKRDKSLEDEEEDEGFSRVMVSLNGVFVNGIRLKSGIVRELNAGDEVLFVCRDESLCRLQTRIGFLILGIIFKEEVVLKRPRLVGTMASLGHSQGSVSSATRSKRVFALRENDVSNPDSVFPKLKRCDIFGRASFLLSQCRNILNSNDPVSCIRQIANSDMGIMSTYGCFSTKFPGRSSIDGELKVKKIERISQQERKPCDESIYVGQPGSITFEDERVVDLEAEGDPVDPCVHNDHLHHKDSVGISNKNATPGVKSKLLNSVDRQNATHFGSMDKSKSLGSSCSPPGKKFYLNRLEFMDLTSLNYDVISLPELLYPVESISRMFIATFTSDILWFPPFPESVAFGENCKKQGIACHHPKLFVLQREDSIRVIVTSANLGAKQWNAATNTVWWQDFPRRRALDYLSLFVQTPVEEINQDSRSDFAAQLASFMASLVIDVPSQAHWIVELTKYDFASAAGHLVASVPGIHSYRNPNLSESTYSKPVDHGAIWSSDGKFLGSVETSVVGLSHLFCTAADSNGTQIKKLAAFLGKSFSAHGMLKILLRRNTNVPADANAVSVLVPNPDELSDGDCVQLGFIPRDIAKWVSPLWDIGFIRFSGFISRDEVLAAALEGISKKVELILHVSQGPKFSDISKMMQIEHVVALSSLIASIQRCRGLWRLQEVLGSSSIGSINAQFLAAFAAASGKKSLRFYDSEESDPEWGCWSASQELRSPSIRIIFPTIERVRNACDGILPSKRVLCFSEQVSESLGIWLKTDKKTWQRLRNVDILHDAIPHPHDRVGHPMHVKVAWRRFQSRTDTSLGWVYCGSHNFSAAAWGRPIQTPSSIKPNGSEKTKSSSSQRLHICNYELGIVFVFPPMEKQSSTGNNTSNLDDIVLPFVVPAPKYRPKDRPATAQAMREALTELYEQQRSIIVEPAEEMMEIPDEEEELEATDYVGEEKEEEKAYADKLWSEVDSSQSS
ncbi:FHA domain-containing protein [Citrus sinensis]|nr:FHA domain-containing protein [Citrus sinensis]